MRVSEELRKSGGWQARFLPIATLAMAVAFAGAACAQQADAKANVGGGVAAATKPADGGNVQAQDSEGLKRLIEQKMREQRGAESNSARRAVRRSPAPASRPAALTPQRVQLSREAVPSSLPTQNNTPGGQPAKGCSGGGKVQVDLTPPPPDQPQPRWTVAQDTVEVPPVWKGSKAEFVFHVRNAGEGPLNIQLRGG